MVERQPPKVFISYSWDDDSHREWVREFAIHLRQDGINATLDQWIVVPGDRLPSFMEQSVRESDFVLCICTSQYKERSDQRSGGVGYEGDIITAEVFANHDPRKFIPILRSGEWNQAAPSWLLGKYYIDLRGDPYSKESYADLIKTLFNQRESAPPIGIGWGDSLVDRESPDLFKPETGKAEINQDDFELVNRELHNRISGDSTAETPSPKNNKKKRKPSRSRSSRAEPPTAKPPKKVDGDPSDEVAFTAFHSEKGKIDTWYTLLVYAHLVSAIDDVYRDAGRFKDQLPVPRTTKSDKTTHIAHGTRISVIPSCDGIMFNPPDMYIEWREDYHRLNFRFRADRSLLNNAAKGCITLMVGPLIIGTLNFSMLFSDQEEISSMVQEEHTSMYQRDRIFISYSHKDTNLVSAFKKVHEATGFDVLIDIDDLRSGQEWNPELMRMIDCADIFQLFWSENSKSSKYCRQEWKHALKRSRDGFIRPVYWQTPMPNPPKELSKYHFEYVEL